MNTKIGNIVKKQLRTSAIVKEIPGQGLKQQNTIDAAVDSVLTEFVSVSKDSDGRQRLYNAVNLLDAVKLANKASSSDEASAQLNLIVGDEGERRLVKQVRTGSDLTEVQAKNVLAGVSPSVLKALKSELTHGTAENSAAGLATLLNSRGTVAPVNSTRADSTGKKPANAQPVRQTVYTSGGVAAAESGNSWFVRFALPVVLMGALILGSIKYCSDSEKSRVVAEERGNLQLELNSAQEESELQTNRIASLQGEYDSAQSQIGQLQGEYDSAQTKIGQLQDELQVSKAEVEALRDVPVDTAELQQSLASATSDRNAAIDSASELIEQLEQVSTERDQTLQREVKLKAELEQARTTITGNEESIANIDVLKAKIEEITTSRDDALQRNLERTATNEKLLEQVNATAPTITGLESQVEKLEGEVASLADEKKQLETNLDDTTQALAEARAARLQDTERLTADNTDLAGQLTQMLGFRDEAETSLEKQDVKVAEQIETIATLQEQVSSLEKANEEAGQSAMLLQKRIDDLDVELKNAQESIANRDTQLKESAETLKSTNEKLNVALGEFNDLEKERDGLVETQEELTQKIEVLNTEKSAAADELESRDAKITELTGDLQTAMSAGEADETRIAELESSLEREQSTIAELEGSNVLLEQEKSTLQSDYETASGKIDALDAQLIMQGRKLLQERKTITTLNATAVSLEADAQALTDETNSLRENIERQLVQAGINDARVQSVDDDRAVAITLGSGNLFQTGDASLTREGGVVLAKIGKILTNYSDWRIDVEGHTDSYAIGKSLRKRYPTNWELSSARASAAVRHMKNIGGVDAESLSVHGFAETRPIADNSNARGRELNRRVDIILRR